jgi:hypothetical protein
MSYACVPEVIYALPSFSELSLKNGIFLVYLLIQGGDIILSDWGMTTSAFRCKLLKVAHLCEEHKFFSLQKLASMKKTVLLIRTG